jgi:hypothetical protein
MARDCDRLNFVNVHVLPIVRECSMVEKGPQAPGNFTAVDHKLRARHLGGFVRGQVQDQFGTPPLQRQ